MSRGNSRSDGLAPSLFPFLAVLLCTMGALVLILMLSVAGAHSATSQILSELEEQYQLEEAKIELVKSGLNEKIAENRVALEKKRLALQAIEKHIDELIEELEQLEKQMELADSAKEDGKESDEQLEKEISELEKQLAEATENLEQQLEEPNGDKPIFAIIPYEGTNGTHRRPIYLECNSQGVIIQPEGVVLSPADLKPPYGPGNPLDSALRTIRAEFPSTTGSVTNNPYPLLVVRPSGIRHYMMARSAMTGWDDQFGYELVSEELDLAYPPGPAHLKDKIVQALERARQRQAALMAAMPKHYENSSFGYDSGPESSMFASGGGRGGNSQADFSGEPFDGISMGGNSLTGTGQSIAGDQLRGTMTDGGSSLLTGGTGLRDSGGPFSGSDSSGIYSQEAFGRGTLSQSTGEAGSLGTGPFEDRPLGDRTFGEGSFGEGSSGQGTFGSGESSSLGAAGAGGSQIAGSTAASASGTSHSQGGSGEASMSSMGSSGASGFAASNSAGSMQVPVNMVGSPGSPNLSMQAGSAQSAGVCDQDCGPGATMQSGDSMDSIGPVQPSISANWSKSPEVARPIAQSRGANWAWERPQRTQTAVVRSIQMRCQLDRWVILPEKGSKAAPVVIDLDGTPEQRAERLAQAVRQRVEGWGVALANGHWSPVLQVEVAPDADWRFEQLRRLMEGSGIGVVRKDSQEANQR